MNIIIISENDKSKSSNSSKYPNSSKYELKVKKIVNDMISKLPNNNTKIRLGGVN